MGVDLNSKSKSGDDLGIEKFKDTITNKDEERALLPKVGHLEIESGKENQKVIEDDLVENIAHDEISLNLEAALPMPESESDSDSEMENFIANISMKDEDKELLTQVSYLGSESDSDLETMPSKNSLLTKKEE